MPVNGDGVYVTEMWTYTGTLKNGVPEEPDAKAGSKTFRNGMTIKGSFKNGEPDVIIGVKYADGSEYEGGMDGFARNGMGTYIKGNRKYVGNFVNDAYEGNGTLYRNDIPVKQGKKKVTGMWVKVYSGEWKDSMRHGYGTSYEEDGSSYTGYWICNRRNGEGVEYSAKNRMPKKGTWADNLLTSENMGKRKRKDRNYWNPNAKAPWGWAVLSAVIPGAGQLLRGSRKSGLFFFITCCLLLIAGTLRFNHDFEGINLIVAAFLLHLFAAIENLRYVSTGKTLF